MTTVLLLHPGSSAFRQEQVRAHAPVLAALGLELALADDAPEAADRELFAEVLELPHPSRVDAAWERLRPWLDSRRIAGVLAQSEVGLPLGALAARHLGVPGPAPDAVLACVSKLETRRRLAAAGVPQPRFALARCAAEVRAFARESGFPVVLKGVSSALARLVTLVRSSAEVEPSVARLATALPHSEDVQRLASFARVAELDLGCDPTREFLVEEFAPGEALETDGVLAGRTALSYGVVEQLLTPPPRFFMEGYLLPADRGPEVLERVEQRSARALEVLGLSDTGFSIELRWHAGEARIIEVKGRLGWDEGFGDLFALRGGAQPVFQALEVCLGRTPTLRPSGAHAALLYRSCFENARVLRAPDEAAFERLRARGLRAGLAHGEGARLHAPPDPRCRPHLAWVLARHPTSSRAAANLARAALAELSFELTPTD